MDWLVQLPQIVVSHKCRIYVIHHCVDHGVNQIVFVLSEIEMPIYFLQKKKNYYCHLCFTQQKDYIQINETLFCFEQVTQQ